MTWQVKIGPFAVDKLISEVETEALAVEGQAKSVLAAVAGLLRSHSIGEAGQVIVGGHEGDDGGHHVTVAISRTALPVLAAPPVAVDTTVETVTSAVRGSADVIPPTVPVPDPPAPVPDPVLDVAVPDVPDAPEPVEATVPASEPDPAPTEAVTADSPAVTPTPEDVEVTTPAKPGAKAAK